MESTIAYYAAQRRTVSLYQLGIALRLGLARPSRLARSLLQGLALTDSRAFASGAEYRRALQNPTRECERCRGLICGARTSTHSHSRNKKCFWFQTHRKMSTKFTMNTKQERLVLLAKVSSTLQGD